MGSRFIFIVLLSIFGLTSLVSASQRTNRADMLSFKPHEKDPLINASHCRSKSQTVWIKTTEGGVCIKYFAAGLDVINPVVMIHFPGDRVHFSKLKRSIGNLTSAPLKRNEDALFLMATTNAFRNGMPFIYISRPGHYGASGYSGMQWTEMNPLILNAAIDAIKHKYKILRLSLSGQKDGAEVVSALINWRNDINCAVIGAMRGTPFQKRILASPMLHPSLDHQLFYPARHIAKIPKDENRRIFFLSDTNEKMIRKKTQKRHYHKIRNAGHHAQIIEVNAYDRFFEDLSGYSLSISRDCTKGKHEGNLHDLASKDDMKSIFDIKDDLKILMDLVNQKKRPG